MISTDIIIHYYRFSESLWSTGHRYRADWYFVRATTLVIE
jgi:hypothetical protein